MPKRSKAYSSDEKAQMYALIVERIFFDNCVDESPSIPFKRDEIKTVAVKLGIRVPKNLGDVIYTFRYRSELPQKVREKAPENRTWVIRPAGTGNYKFEPVVRATFAPNDQLGVTRIPNATPGMIERYALTDEQALLAKLAYNRLIDLFLGITTYRLQSHLRTTVPDMGQTETDDVYVGLDRRGEHFVIPVQAKGGKDVLSVVQIEQDMAMAAGHKKFQHMKCIPVAAQFMKEDVIALFTFERMSDEEVAVVEERHYQLVPQEQLTPDELGRYSQRQED